MHFGYDTDSYRIVFRRKTITKENGKVKNFNVKKFIIAMLIAAIICVSVLSVLFGIDKTFSSDESITVSLIEAGNIR